MRYKDLFQFKTNIQLETLFALNANEVELVHEALWQYVCYGQNDEYRKIMNSFNKEYHVKETYIQWSQYDGEERSFCAVKRVEIGEQRLVLLITEKLYNEFVDEKLRKKRNNEI